MALKKRVRIIKKIRPKPGVWTFISMRKIGNRYVWDKRPGYFFVEWWEGKKRRREIAGQTPSEATGLQPNAESRTQKLLGHPDIDTTRQYLNPDEALKRQVVNRLSLSI